MTENCFEVLAPAKINLFLHLISKRDDGYHNIESLFAFTDFGDLVKVEESNDLSLEIIGPFAERFLRLEIEDNLVMKAARGLQKTSKTKFGAKITLTKNLPLAAGIGGGSSDAAATLKALIKLWKTEISENELFKLTLSLGADVPACFYGKPAFVSGIGEILEPVKGLKGMYCVLVNPGVSVSTPEVFMSYKGDFSNSINTIDAPDFINFRNDLQEIAISMVPEIKAIVENLANEKGSQMARMSGSGATCFGVFNSMSEAKEAEAQLLTSFPKWWVMAGQIKGH